jgi:Glycosyl hydrolase family 3 N terminal domain
MAAAIGTTMHMLGIHQGLAPVLDVTRDPRWGRTEESIGEDPCLVASIGTAYVQGLQSAGVHATLKHFAGYSASRAARNLAPVSMGRREFADIMLPPFEAALRLGGARSVMPSYTDIDGIPVTGDRQLLTSTLRDELGFDGVAVSDYNAISFLDTLHGSPRQPPRPARWPSTPVSTSSCPSCAAAAPSWQPPCPAANCPENSSTGQHAGFCGRSAISGCSTRTGPRPPPRQAALPTSPPRAPPAGPPAR